MIHNILIPWPNLNYDTDLGIVNVKGDTITLNVTIDGIDLNNYKIRCQIGLYSRIIQLANENAGGSDEEIIAIDSESGMSAFQVKVSKDLTNDFLNYGVLEIEIEDATGNKYTVLQQRVTFLDETIDWNIPS